MDLSDVCMSCRNRAAKRNYKVLRWTGEMKVVNLMAPTYERHALWPSPPPVHHCYNLKPADMTSSPWVQDRDLAWVYLEQCNILCGDTAPVLRASKAKGVAVQVQHAANHRQCSLQGTTAAVTAAEMFGSFNV